MSLELSIQKLNIDEARSILQQQINELNHRQKVLIRGMKAIDQENENMLESRSILASEVRSIMRGIILNNSNKIEW